MKRIIFALVCAIGILSGCGAPPKTSKPQSVSMPSVTYIIPTGDGLVHQNGLIEDISLGNLRWYGQTDIETDRILLPMIIKPPKIDSLELLFSQKTSDNAIVVERRSAVIDNAGGSGKRYTVSYTVLKEASDYKIIFKSSTSYTYNNGSTIHALIVPKFDENDLSQYLMDSSIYYRLEMNSEFNSESTYANFARILKTRDFHDGEKDPVTGKIFKQQFVLPYREKEVLFTLESFPYRNGSKAVMYLRVPSVATSPNTVDYRIIINEIKAKLTEIVKS